MAVEVLQTGLVVHDHPPIRARQGVHVFPQQAVGEAVATGTLGPSHLQHIEARSFSHRLVHAVLRPGPLVPTRGNIAQRGFTGETLLAQRPHRHRGAETQQLAQIGVRVGINGQHGRLALFHQVADEKGTEGSLPGAALPCHRYQTPMRWSVPSHTFSRPAEPESLRSIVGKRLMSVCGRKLAAM